MSFFLYLLHVTIALVIFYGFFLLFLQKETTFGNTRSYLIGSIIAALVIPLIRIYIESNTVLPIDIPEYVFVGSYLEATVSVEPRAFSFSWQDAALIIYCSGVVFAILRLCMDFQKILSIRRRGKLISFNGKQCILSEHVKCPYSFFNIIYLPADHSFNEAELAEVIKHEYAHIAGRHSIDILFIEIVTAFLWMNPVIYLYRSRLRELHEFLADADVIKTSPWDQYAELLIAHKGHGLQNKLSNQLVYSQLKKRLIMMTQKPSSAWSRMRYLGFIPLILMGIIILSFRQKDQPADNSKEIIVPENSIAKAVEETSVAPVETPKVLNIYKDGLKVYTALDMPLFPGCSEVWTPEAQTCSREKMFAFISNELVYPEALKTAGIEGTVITKFIVSAKGKITKSWIERPLHPAADEAALNVIYSMNKKAGRWTPSLKEGKPVEMEMVLPISFKLGAEKDKEVYTLVEQMPSFGKSTQDLYEYIYKTIRYPEEDRENSVEGQVIVQFVVLPDGNLSGIKVVRGKSPTLDAEAIRVIEGMNALPERWTPGLKDGKPVAVMFTLPIKFVLQPEQQSQAIKLQVTEELKYYVNSKEVPSGMLEDVLRDAVKLNQDRTVVLHIDKNLTVQDLVDVMTVAEKLNLRMVLDTETTEKHAEEKKSTSSSYDFSGQKSTDDVIKVYPNPTTGVITIDLFEGARMIRITDDKGQVVLTRNLNENQTKVEVETHSLPQGNYILQVISDKATKAMKFVKA